MMGYEIPPALPVLFAVLFSGGALEALAARRAGAPPSARLIGLWRAGVLAVAVAASYPALFDLRAATPLRALLAAEPWSMVLARLAPWLVAVLASLLPLSVRGRAIAEAMQGLTATAALFALFMTDLGVTAARLLPGWPAGILVVVATATAVALVESGRAAAAPQSAWRSGFALAAQAPVLLLYGFALGRQVAVG